MGPERLWKRSWSPVFEEEVARYNVHPHLPHWSRTAVELQQNTGRNSSTSIASVLRRRARSHGMAGGWWQDRGCGSGWVDGHSGGKNSTLASTRWILPEGLLREPEHPKNRAGLFPCRLSPSCGASFLALSTETPFPQKEKFHLHKKPPNLRE